MSRVVPWVVRLTWAVLLFAAGPALAAALAPAGSATHGLGAGGGRSGDRRTTAGRPSMGDRCNRGPHRGAVGRRVGACSARALAAVGGVRARRVGVARPDDAGRPRAV